MYDGTTDLYAIVGQPAESTLSPVMHNYLFDTYDVNAVFLAFESDIGPFTESARALPIQGFSVTKPFKQAVVEQVDELRGTSADIETVNAVDNVDGKLVGYNTDATGAAESLDEHFPMDDSRVVIFGAGGAARAVARGVTRFTDDVVLLNRTGSSARKLASILDLEWDHLRNYDEYRGDVVINCTSVGMQSDESIVEDEEFFEKFSYAMDVVYNPTTTCFMQLAEDGGCETMNGLDMLVKQGARAFEIWVDVSPDEDDLKRFVIDHLGLD